MSKKTDSIIPLPPAGLKFERNVKTNKVEPKFLHQLDESDLNLLIKNNTLVSGMYNLTALENEVVNTALMIAMQQLESGKRISADDVFRISYKSFAKMWGVDLSNSQKSLAKCCLSLRQKSFWYFSTDPDTKEKKVYESGWFAWVTPKLVNKEFFEFGFPKPLIPFLEGAAIDSNGNKKKGYFTWLYFEEMKKLRGKFYAQRFYEIFSQFKHIKSEVTLTVEEIRNIFLLPETRYKNIAELKRNILDKVHADINGSTRLKFDYSDIKEGKYIVAFKFNLKFDYEDKNFKKALGKELEYLEQKDPNTEDLFVPLTPPQIKTFASLLASDHEFGRDYCPQGVKKSEFIIQIAQDLQDPIKLAELMPHLIKVGYDPDYKNNQ
ncbi:replication initiation protein [Acinetobacter pittii]|uniref:replication initiation protein n=1 Tax=Acinetobacter pittii TaxID=48296 RepID=UPI003260F48C